ncbi:MAG: Rare lipoprotein A [uncultured bacterium]|nr:MAG: Rare lipoprotein A [uncultured bacterium]
MSRKKSLLKLFSLSLSLLALFFIGQYLFFKKPLFLSKRTLDFSSASKKIVLLDNEAVFYVSTRAQNVESFLQEQKIKVENHDEIFPEKNTALYSGMHIRINHSIPFEIKVDGKTIKNQSSTKTVSGILEENGVVLGRLDIVSKPLYSRFAFEDKIVVTRINVEEKIVEEDINYKTITKEDRKLGWREEKTEQAGKKGIREIKYKITYKDNKEISRVILEKNITKEPINAILVKGTYMKLGGAKKGQGTWYSFKGGLFAASTTIPRGGFAKVTNTANGKSVIVEINDYGPQGKGRIIDLDKVAFTKIASLGAGVIGVKVEQVLN